MFAHALDHGAPYRERVERLIVGQRHLDDEPAVKPVGQYVRWAARRNTHGLSLRVGGRSSNQYNAVLVETPGLGRVESAFGRASVAGMRSDATGTACGAYQPPTEAWSWPSGLRHISLCYTYLGSCLPAAVAGKRLVLRYEETIGLAGQLAGEGVLERTVLVPKPIRGSTAGDPNVLHQIDRRPSPSLKKADGVLHTIAASGPVLAKRGNPRLRRGCRKRTVKGYG